jgi:hypothetical protein
VHICIKLQINKYGYWDTSAHVGGTQTALAGKHWNLPGPTNKLITGEKYITCRTFSICLCSKPFSLQSLLNHLEFQTFDNISMTRDRKTFLCIHYLPGSRLQLWSLSQNKDWDNDQTTHVAQLFSYDNFFHLSSYYFCLFKLIAYVYTPEHGWR